MEKKKKKSGRRALGKLIWEECVRLRFSRGWSFDKTSCGGLHPCEGLCKGPEVEVCSRNKEAGVVVTEREVERVGNKVREVMGGHRMGSCCPS